MYAPVCPISKLPVFVYIYSRFLFFCLTIFGTMRSVVHTFHEGHNITHIKQNMAGLEAAM